MESPASPGETDTLQSRDVGPHHQGPTFGSCVNGEGTLVGAPSDITENPLRQGDRRGKKNK